VRAGKHLGLGIGVSRGLGAVAIKLKEVFDRHPTDSFSTSELCQKVHPGQRVQKKHRVSVLRALRTLVRSERLEIWRLELAHEKADVVWFGRRCHYKPKEAERLNTTSSRVGEKSKKRSARKTKSSPSP
jgi:hypothetical protein